VVNAGPQETPQFDAVRRQFDLPDRPSALHRRKNSAVIMAIFAAKHKANVAQR